MNRSSLTNPRYRRIPERIIDCIERIDEAEIRSHVDSFCKIGPRCDDFPLSVHRTLAYLKKALDQYGYQVEEEQSDSEYQTNVIAELPGTVSQNRVFEIGAHYDTKPDTPGADDNASGLAGLLEIARVMARVKTRRTIRFCFFGSEETTRGGSRTHVARIVSRKHERLAGVLVFEMIGYRTYDSNSQRTPVRIPLVLWPPRTGGEARQGQALEMRQLTSESFYLHDETGGESGPDAHLEGYFISRSREGRIESKQLDGPIFAENDADRLVEVLKNKDRWPACKKVHAGKIDEDYHVSTFDEVWEE